MIPLICIDVDGTLVGSTGEVTDGVWTAVDAALARGQHLALTTARGAFASSWNMAQRLDPNGWHVFHAGGATVHTGTAVSRGHALTDEELDLAMNVAQRNNWVLELYSPTAYAVDADSVRAVDHAALMGVPFARQELDVFRSADDAMVRVQFVVAEDEVDAVRTALSETTLVVTSATSPIMPGTAFVSATKAGITKATGINTICADLGIDIGQVMMIGDGHNDVPAIEAVGHAVAMGNAVDDVKSLARYTVADVDNDGVAEALELSAELG